MLRSIQILRALAAWLVVGHHVAQLYFGLQTSNHLAGLFARYGEFGVDLFFIISGFVIYVSSDRDEITPSRFLFHRLARVVPAYWFFTTLVAAVLLVDSAFIPFTKLEPIFFLKSLMFWPALNPSGVGPFPLLTVGWTLNLEMAFYGVFCLAVFAPARWRILAVFAGIMLLHTSTRGLPSALALYGNTIVFEFLIGVAVGFAYRQGWVALIKTPIAIAMIVVAILVIAKSSGAHDFVEIGLPFGGIVVAMLSQERRLNRLGSIACLGDWSYSTYLCHVIVLSAGLQMHVHWNVPLHIVLPLMLILIAMTSKISHSLIEIRTKEWLLLTMRRHSAKDQRLQGAGANIPLE